MNYYSFAEGGDLDNAGERFSSALHVSRPAASVNEQGSYNGTSQATTAGPSRLQLLARQRSYRAQTSDEVKELEKMITKAATTPRKAKRVCNMYDAFEMLRWGNEVTTSDPFAFILGKGVSRFLNYDELLKPLINRQSGLTIG